ARAAGRCHNGERRPPGRPHHAVKAAGVAMNPLTPELALAWPEILLAAGICVVLIVDLFVRQENRDVTYLLTIALLVGVALALLDTGEESTALAFGGSFVA